MIRRIVGGLMAATVGIGLLALVVAWSLDGRGALDRDGDPSPIPQAAFGSAVERGEYLSLAANCGGCHTADGGRPYAGGVLFRLPIGTIYSSNITPDLKAGIGGWSDDDFVRAVRGGIAPGGRHLYPVFPYTSFTGLTRGDVLAIKAYLATLPAAEGTPPANTLSFPFSRRPLVMLWNVIGFKSGRFAPDKSHDDAWNRGNYLATALGHCGECHTPRGITFATDRRRELEGGVAQTWKAYNITPDREDGIGAWTVEDVRSYLHGDTPAERPAAAGQMGEVVNASLRHLHPDDLDALARFLLPQASTQSPGQKPAARNPEPVPYGGPASAEGGVDTRWDGSRIFDGACVSCHPRDGGAAANGHGRLKGARSVRDPEAVNVVLTLLNGSSDRKHLLAPMPAFAAGYSNAEIARLANYVVDSYGGVSGQVTPERVLQLRAAAGVR